MCSLLCCAVCSKCFSWYSQPWRAHKPIYSKGEWSVMIGADFNGLVKRAEMKRHCIKDKKCKTTDGVSGIASVIWKRQFRTQVMISKQQYGFMLRKNTTDSRTIWRTIRMDPFTLHRPLGFSVRRCITCKRPHRFMLLVKVSYLPRFLCAFSYLVLPSPLTCSSRSSECWCPQQGSGFVADSSPLRFTPFTISTCMSSWHRLLWISGKTRLESSHLLSTLGAHLAIHLPQSLLHFTCQVRLQYHLSSLAPPASSLTTLSLCSQLTTLTPSPCVWVNKTSWRSVEARQNTWEGDRCTSKEHR